MSRLFAQLTPIFAVPQQVRFDPLAQHHLLSHRQSQLCVQAVIRLLPDNGGAAGGGQNDCAIDNFVLQYRSCNYTYKAPILIVADWGIVRFEKTRFSRVIPLFSVAAEKKTVHTRGAQKVCGAYQKRLAIENGHACNQRYLRLGLIAIEAAPVLA
ncbi:hypothetical protein [Pseudomonas sp. FP1740]|uniref:hypothetical protein n=1 Tax=Pseudomonas sp. FP1740 TaxID=2954078 RepID=UPI0027369B9D|nr:hypothetical protein [Pseudomonas sp. FP1740]WLG42731.1 hypothetical protein PSH69_17700 [Pseudomonas sp. FP1740]